MSLRAGLSFVVGLFFGLLLVSCQPSVQGQEQTAEKAGDGGLTKEGLATEAGGDVGGSELPPEARLPEARSEALVESRPEPSPEATSEFQPEATQERRPETKPEPRPEVPPEAPPREDYNKAGPLAFATLTRRPLTLPSATGCSGDLCTVTLEITYPTAPAGTRKPPYPLAVFSNGFQLEASRYKSYAERLATWGYIAIRWDTTGENLFRSMTHKTLSLALIEIIGWADTKAESEIPALKGFVDAKKTYLVGHSRGGKISVLAAQSDARVKAVFGIDPVDSAPPGQSVGPDYPSALAGLPSFRGGLAVVGADRSAQGFQPCAPTADNYQQFYKAAPSPAWEILIQDSGHMQFLDSRSGCLPCFACTNGQTSDATIRSITQTAMIAWGEGLLRQAPIAGYRGGGWAAELQSQTK